MTCSTYRCSVSIFALYEWRKRCNTCHRLHFQYLNKRWYFKTNEYFVKHLNGYKLLCLFIMRDSCTWNFHLYTGIVSTFKIQQGSWDFTLGILPQIYNDNARCFGENNSQMVTIFFSYFNSKIVHHSRTSAEERFKHLSIAIRLAQFSTHRNTNLVLESNQRK
jgi:hypothetical protein